MCGWVKNDCYMTFSLGLLFCFSSNVTTISTHCLVEEDSQPVIFMIMSSALLECLSNAAYRYSASDFTHKKRSSLE